MHKERDGEKANRRSFEQEKNKRDFEAGNVGLYVLFPKSVADITFF